MTTKLDIYNNALLTIGERRLASLTEESKRRFELDFVWDNGFVDDVLEHGYWNFAIITSRVEPDTGVEPDFGLRFAYEKPNDYVRSVAVSEDEYFDVPLRRYADENGYWFADITPIYVKYISNDSAYGNDLANWPQSFRRWAEHYLGLRVYKPIAQPTDQEMANQKNENEKLLMKARSMDAMNEPSKSMPINSWASSRRGRSYRIGFNNGGQ